MNQRIRRLAIALLALYAILFVQLNIIQVGRKSNLDADSRNTRLTVRTFNDPRGAITTIDGKVIAESVRSEPGSEHPWKRVYSDGELYAHVTGYYTFAYGATQIKESPTTCWPDSPRATSQGLGLAFRRW